MTYSKYREIIEKNSEDIVEELKDEFEIEELEMGFENMEIQDNFYEIFRSQWHNILHHKYFDQLKTELTTAAHLLSLVDELATDSGLWEGLKDPRDKINSMAFYSVERDLRFQVEEDIKDYLDRIDK